MIERMRSRKIAEISRMAYTSAIAPTATQAASAPRSSVSVPSRTGRTTRSST